MKTINTIINKIAKLFSPYSTSTADAEENQLDKSNLYDVQTIQIMQTVLKSNSNCIDVGCHRGDFLKTMLEIAPQGEHYAFKPLPAMFKGLEYSFRTYQNVHLFDCAVSDTEGLSTFQNVVNLPSHSGLRQRKYDIPNVEIEEITVKTNLLDNIIPENQPIKFIKVDVEGAELQVFRGALKTIKRNRPIIVFEHGLGAADYYDTKPEEIFDLLVTQCGLSIFFMSDWITSKGKKSLSREAFISQFNSCSNYYFLAA